jgi:hypothetical protein
MTTSGEHTMHSYHSPHHWIPVAIVLAIALLTLHDAHGQRSDSVATFQGRPAPAGPQASTGAMGGPPQGGIAVEGQVSTSQAAADNRAVRNNEDIVKREHDSGVAKPRESVAQRAKNAVKRIVQRSKHGVSDRDIQTAQH